MTQSTWLHHFHSAPKRNKGPSYIVCGQKVLKVLRFTYILCAQFGDSKISWRRVYEWIDMFTKSRSVNDAHCSGRPSAVRIDESRNKPEPRVSRTAKNAKYFHMLQYCDVYGWYASQIRGLLRRLIGFITTSATHALLITIRYSSIAL
jgi:hypothetical protein